MGNFLKDLGGAVLEYNPITIATDAVTGGKVSEALGLNKNSIPGVYETASGVYNTLSGEDARKAQEEANRLAMQSAQAGIASEQEQLDFIRKLFEPYYKTAESSLPGLQALIMGGKVADNYNPSALYEFQKKMGERNIMRSQAAKGMLGSSGTEMKLADLYGNLGSEESNRVYSDLLSQIQLGTGALGSFGNANASSANSVGSLYGNLGRQLGGLESAYGQSRASAYQGLSNAFMGLGQYMAIKGV